MTRATLASLAMTRFVASGPNADLSVVADLETDAPRAIVSIELDGAVPLFFTSRRLPELLGLLEGIHQALWQTRPETVANIGQQDIPTPSVPQSPPTLVQQQQAVMPQTMQQRPPQGQQNVTGRQPQARAGLELTPKQWDYLNNLINDNGLDNASALQMGYGMGFFPESVDTLDKLDRQQGSKLIEELKGRLMRERAGGQDVPR